MISPMTEWLRGGRSRSLKCRGFSPLMNGDCVQIVLYEANCSLAGATAPTVEQAMADALNALMSQEGDSNVRR